MLVEANARVHIGDSWELGDENETLQSNNGPADFKARDTNLLCFL